MWIDQNSQCGACTGGGRTKTRDYNKGKYLRKSTNKRPNKPAPKRKYTYKLRKNQIVKYHKKRIRYGYKGGYTYPQSPSPTKGGSLLGQSLMNGTLNETPPNSLKI